MGSYNEVEKSVLHDWVEIETRAIDLVASWESLCDTYRALEFADEMSDSTRMEEFKWIVKEMNKHLTRARRLLLSCKDVNSARDLLIQMFTPAGQVSITGRKDLAYHKLRQRWVSRMLAQLDAMTEELLSEGENNGEPGY